MILDQKMRISAIILGAFLMSGSLQAQGTLPVLQAIRPPYLILGEGQDSVELKGLSAATSQLIFMVFHAEQDVIGLDPGLSTDGRWRAIRLLQILMGPDDLVMTVHLQTLPQIIERFTGSPWKPEYSTQPTDLIFIIERKPGQKGVLHTFRYKIR